MGMYQNHYPQTVKYWICFDGSGFPYLDTYSMLLSSSVCVPFKASGQPTNRGRPRLSRYLPSLNGESI